MLPLRALVAACLLTLLPSTVEAAGELQGQDIAVVIVCESANCYWHDAQAVVAALSRPSQAGGPGANVNVYRLSSDALLHEATNTAMTVSGLFNHADQVWVIDFSSAADNAAIMMQTYAEVATWFEQAERHLILDGRLLSSLSPGPAKNHYTVARPDEGLIVRYATALAERGGGLVLATDHAADFTRGINHIAGGIGVGPFNNYNQGAPHLAIVDTAHVLFAQRPEATYSAAALDNPSMFDTHLPDCGACSFLLDDSTSSSVPVGPQPSGPKLFAVALNATNNNPVVSTSITAAPVPTVEIEPSGPDVLAFDAALELTGSVTGGDPFFTWRWIGADDDELGSDPTLALALAPGDVETVTLTVTDVLGRTSSATVTVYSGFCETEAHCPSGRSCVDGVCCDTACGDGATDDCQACSVAAGAPADGTCAPLDAVPCDDGDACTQADICDEGVCVGADPVVCAALDECHVAGICDPASGACSDPPADNGTTCSIGTCDDGICTEPEPEPDAGIDDEAGFDGGDEDDAGFDGGPSIPDAGFDAGSSPVDAGFDAGSSPVDAGDPGDGGGVPTTSDAGDRARKDKDGNNAVTAGCTCAAGPKDGSAAHGLALLGLLGLVGVRRRRR